MADFAIYWKNYVKDCKNSDNSMLTEWFTNADRVIKTIQPNDRIWFFTSGDACGMSDTRKAYLVEVFIVLGTGPNPGQDGDYPPGDFHYAIQGDPNRCLVVNPPLLIDNLIRPGGDNDESHIGQVRQSPVKLKSDVAFQLETFLRNNRPELVRNLADQN